LAIQSQNDWGELLAAINKFIIAVLLG